MFREMQKFNYTSKNTYLQVLVDNVLERIPLLFIDDSLAYEEKMNVIEIRKKYHQLTSKMTLIYTKQAYYLHTNDIT